MLSKIGNPLKKGVPILKENRKSIQILFPKLGNSFKKYFPISEIEKIGNLTGSPDQNVEYQKHQLQLHIFYDLLNYELHSNNNIISSLYLDLNITSIQIYK